MSIYLAVICRVHEFIPVVAKTFPPCFHIRFNFSHVKSESVAGYLYFRELFDSSYMLIMVSRHLPQRSMKCRLKYQIS